MTNSNPEFDAILANMAEPSHINQSQSPNRSQSHSLNSVSNQDCQQSNQSNEINNNENIISQNNRLLDDGFKASFDSIFSPSIEFFSPFQRYHQFNNNTSGDNKSGNEGNNGGIDENQDVEDEIPLQPISMSSLQGSSGHNSSVHGLGAGLANSQLRDEISFDKPFEKPKYTTTQSPISLLSGSSLIPNSSPNNSSNTLPISSTTGSANLINNSNNASTIMTNSSTIIANNSPDSVTFASPQNSHWWYNADLDNSQHGIQSEDALIQQTFHGQSLGHSQGHSLSQSGHQNMNIGQVQSMNQGLNQNTMNFGIDGNVNINNINNSISNPKLPNLYKFPTSNSNINTTTNNNDMSNINNVPPRKKSPSIQEAAAMAAEILASSSNTNTNNLYHSFANPSSSNTSNSTSTTNGTNIISTRSKKARPCDSCRRRKVRCIMLPSDTGRCLHCEVKKQACTFLEAPIRKTRAKKPPNGIDKSKGLKNSSNYFDGSTGVGVAGSGSVGAGAGGAKLPKLKYEDYATLGNHNLLKKALSMQYPRSAYYIGGTSVYDQQLFEYKPPNINSNTNNSNNTTDNNEGHSEYTYFLDNDIEVRKVSQHSNNSNSFNPNPTTFLLHNDYTEELYTRSIHNCDTVESIVYPHGQTLINIYFRIVHPSFPILHKKVFIEKYKRTHREFLAPLLAGVYLMALKWWDCEPRNEGKKEGEGEGDNKDSNDSNNDNNNNIDTAGVTKPDAEALLKLAKSTFVDALDRPKLASVQAGLLLLQCQPTTTAGNWMLCSQVVAIAQELALGVDCGRWKIPRWEKGLRRRLSWAVWLQDQWMSLSEGRVAITDRLRSWLLDDLANEDFPDKDEANATHTSSGNGNNHDTKNTSGSGNVLWTAEVDNGRLLFCQMIKLTEIAEDVRNELYSPLTLKINGTQEILEIVKPLQMRLRSWYHSLPKSLFMSNNTNNDSAPSVSSDGNEYIIKKISANGYLHLAYFTCEIILHRRIIRSLTPESPPVLINLCRQAAKTRLVAAINFVSELQTEHLKAFWYSSSFFSFSMIGSFAGLLYVTSSDEDERNEYKMELKRYKEVLENKDFEPMQGAIKEIKRVLWKVEGLWE